MKKFLLGSTCILALGITSSIGQITITQSDMASIGDTIYIAKDTTPNTITIGGTGMQTWNFTSLQMDMMDVNAFVDPSTTFADTSFPNSTIAMDVNNGTQVNYGTLSSGQFQIDGFWGDPLGVGVPVAIPFNPPSKVIKFPSVLNNSFQDTSHFNFIFSDPQLLQFGIDAIKIAHYGYATRKMDAYGLMVTPADSFNTIRQYSVEQLLDSIYMHPIGGNWLLVPANLLPAGMGFTNNPNFDTTYSYAWYANGEGMAVAQAMVDSPGGMVTSASFKISDKVVAGLFSATNISCNGNCDGSATVSAISGYSPYSYLWDSGTGNQTGASVDSLCAGTYTVTITDNVGNKSSASVTISAPAVLTATKGGSDAQCPSCTNGSAYANGAGGTAPYFFSWSNGQSIDSIVNLAPGTYSVTITDYNGCSTVDSVVVGFWATGIKDGMISGNGFRVFPNPSNGKIFVSSEINELKTLKVFNLLGKLIVSEEINGMKSGVDLTKFGEGIYFIQIEGQNSIETQRINVVK